MSDRPDHNQDGPFSGEVDLLYRTTLKIVFRDLFYTFIISGLIGLILSLSDSGRYFCSYFIISESFGMTVCSMALFLLWLFKPRKWLWLFLIVFMAIGGGAVAGMQIGVFLVHHILGVELSWPLEGLLRTLVMAMLFSSGAFYFFISRSRLKKRGEMIEEEKARRVEVEKEALEAKLRMLQAQIEPHFLFNTLSNVVSLIDTDPSRGKAMLLDLTKYLRTSLSRTLPEKTTLAQELDMIASYLNIQKIRMGERLNFKIDVPDALLSKVFPPMLLQPLVENAVKHGLEPKIEGGDIFIRGASDQQGLRLEVTDTGLGFSSVNAGGVGMANVHDRLALLFGDRAKLVIEENAPSGVKVIIEVPLHD